jgi:hypothetical protein
VDWPIGQHMGTGMTLRSALPPLDHPIEFERSMVPRMDLQQQTQPAQAGTQVDITLHGKHAQSAGVQPAHCS